MQVFKVLKKMMGVTAMAAILVSSFFAQAGEQRYVAYRVLPGESLSYILKVKFKFSNVFTPYGLMAQTIAANRGKVFDDGDSIEPGTVLLIPAVTPELKAYVDIYDRALHGKVKITNAQRAPLKTQPRRTLANEPDLLEP